MNKNKIYMFKLADELMSGEFDFKPLIFSSKEKLYNWLSVKKYEFETFLTTKIFIEIEKLKSEKEKQELEIEIRKDYEGYVMLIDGIAIHNDEMDIQEYEVI